MALIYRPPRGELGYRRELYAGGSLQPIFQNRFWIFFDREAPDLGDYLGN
jgi:hypothetical protein